MRSLAGILTIVFLLACSSTPKDFHKVTIGMDKAELLDTIGSPVSSEFKNDEYVWLYRYYEGDTKIEKEVRLKNDVVTYAGEVQKPKGSRFDRLKVGMEKAAVLDLLGFPKRVEKKGASEIWTYQDGTQAKKLTMTAGKVSSLGASPQEGDPKADGFVPVESDD